MTDKNSISWLALLTSAALAASAGGASADGLAGFTAGDLVIDTVSNSTSLTNADALDTASPMTLNEFSLGVGGMTASSVGTLTLPKPPAARTGRSRANTARLPRASSSSPATVDT